MRRCLPILTLLPLLWALLPSRAGAETALLVNAEQIIVRSQPNSGSEALLTLPKGQKVEVLETKGGWSKVQIRLPDGFTFDGYVSSQHLRISPRPTPTPVPPRRPEPAPFPTIPPEVYAPTPVPAPPLEPLFTPEEEPLPPDPWKTAKKKERRAPSSAAGFDEIFFLDVGPTLTFYHYALSNGGAAPASLFSYDLTGAGFRFDGGVWIWRHPSGRFRTGLVAGYRHAFLSCTTILQFTNGEQSRISTGNALYGFSGGAAAEYRLQPNRDAITMGLKIGYDYGKFSGDDILQGDGSPLGLFVSQTTQSLYFSVYAGIPFRPVEFGLGIDLFPVHSVSESPAGTTGTGPAAGFGFAPFLEATYDWTDRHHLTAGYRPRFQGYGYDGSGLRVTTPVTDASVDTVAHELSLFYEFRY